MAVVTALTGSDQTVTTTGGGPGHYYGFSIRETSGTATAEVRIYDNTANSGTLLDTITLNADESAREWYGPQGIQYNTGIRVDVVSGAVEGSIRHG
jgi:hypothetical protein